MQGIKNIILDLGGVLINVDYRAPIRAFQSLGIAAEETLYSKKAQHVLFDEFETGRISPAQFRDRIRSFAHKNITDQEIDDAWNSILLDVPQQRLDLLYRLKNHYRLFLLSNTNAIHIPEFYTILNRAFGKNPFSEIFEHCYYSYEMGMRKPDTEIFTTVLRNHELKAAETFFMDDSPQHVEGAQKAGLHAHWLDLEKEDICTFFELKNAV